ncbi:MAG TPA: hypothetical protein VLA36_15395 [Longimicrobiales bacterium]|nr:hypothetical protein [Longimicrobiales bacterium]
MTEPSSPAVSPTDARDGWLDRVARLVGPPTETLGDQGTIATPLLLVFSISLVSAAAAWTWASSAPPGSGAALLGRSGHLVWLLALAAPLGAALKGLLFAAMAWALLVLFGGCPAGRPLVSALFYGEAILAVQGLWVTGAALAWSLPAPGPGSALPVPSGLDAWVGASSGPLLTVAQNVTPFHLAWVVFLTLAFTRQAAVSWRLGLGTAFLLWGLGTGLAILRTSTV